MMKFRFVWSFVVVDGTIAAVVNPLSLLFVVLI